MSLTITGTIAGTAVTNAAAPVFTPTEDTSAGPNFRRWYITTVASANGANAHNVSSPFYIELHRPSAFKPQPQFDPTGTRVVNGPVGRNTYKLRVIKGVTPASGLYGVVLIETLIHVPSGADMNDAANVRAAMSALGGLFAEDPVGLAETPINGLLS